MERGPAGADEQLLPLIYEHLRRVAREYLFRESSDHTLQPTALVHEVYLRLARSTRTGFQWQSRAHFYHVAVRVMRRILVDHARARNAAKRGGEGAAKISLGTFHGNPDMLTPSSASAEADLVALDEGLQQPRGGCILATLPNRRTSKFFARFGNEGDRRTALQLSERTARSSANGTPPNCGCCRELGVGRQIPRHKLHERCRDRKLFDAMEIAAEALEQVPRRANGRVFWTKRMQARTRALRTEVESLLRFEEEPAQRLIAKTRPSR